PAVDPHAAARAVFDAGLAAYAARDMAAAIDCFNRVLGFRHDHADAHNNLGLCYLETGRREDAVDAFVLATHFKPDFPQAFYHLALAALQERNLTEAVRCLERAIGLNPEFAAAYNTLGYVLTHQTGDFEQGAAHIRKALALKPADPDILCNYCAVLAQEGRAEEALKVCDELLAKHPHMHEARLNRALAQLKRGRFEEAWPDYEARKRARGNYIPRALPFPEWQGEPLGGEKLLIYAEQGLGDQIMFASCVPNVLKLAGTCLIECAPPLVPLFLRSFTGAAVVSQPRDDADLVRTAQAAGVTRQVAIGSLPARFRRHRVDFPNHAGYLRADPARIAYWKNRLDGLGPGLKAGISWVGGTPATRSASRSMQLADWTPIFEQRPCHFVNLQYGSAAAELPAFCRELGGSIHDWRDAVENYDETAALVAALDLVITVQTALVHLAGALGAPTWVMLQATSEWRYGEQGESMSWYPGVRLFRQSRPGDWQTVVASVARDLAQRASS
ncbi:MAG: tetratricopeptide repeat protein, partial [Betaproteobacteria bacterium]